MKIIITAIMTMLSFCAYAGHISSMRCGNGFIEKGMTVDQVKKACGRNRKPVSKEQSVQQRANPRIRYSDGTMAVENHVIERWKFAFYGQYITYVTFRDGRVVDIFETSTRR